MRKMKARGGVLAAGLSLALASALAMPMAALADDSSSTVQWQDPVKNAATANGAYTSKTYDANGNVTSQYILSAVYGYYTPLAEYLGLVNTVSITPGKNWGDYSNTFSVERFRSDGMWGTFASSANQNPDPYWENLWLMYADTSLNISVENGDEVVLIPVEGGMASANTSLYKDSGVPESFYYRPDIICSGQNAVAKYQKIVDGINKGVRYATDDKGNYTDEEIPLPESSIKDGDATYDPYLISQKATYNGVYLAAGSMNGAMQVLYFMSDAVEELETADSTKTTRYEDSPTDIVANLEELDYGSRYYVLSEIEKGNIQKKTVAFVNSVNAAEQTVTLNFMKDGMAIGTEATGSSTSFFQPWYDLDGVVTNLCDTLDLSGYTVTAARDTWTQQVTVPIDVLKQADIAFCTDGAMASAPTVSESDLNVAYDQAGFAEDERPLGYFQNPIDLGLGGWNADRICYMPSWIGFIYPELATNSEMMAYYYYYIAHVTKDSITNVVKLNAPKMTLRAGDSLNEPAEGYDAVFANIKAKLVKGMQYYAANAETVEALNANLADLKDADGKYQNPRFYDGTYESSRLAGEDRYGTMAEVVKAGWSKSDTVVLVSGEGFADALAASSLAGLYDAPVVLTNSATLNAEAETIIASLGATKVFVVGGVNSVSDDVVAKVKQNIGATAQVERIAGADRVATSYEVYKAGEGKWGEYAIVAQASNFADALSASSVAFAKGAPIFLANGNLTDEQVSAMSGFKTVLIAGGTGSVPASVEDQLSGKAHRLAGEDRYGTSVEIAKYAISTLGMSAEYAGLADGRNFPDALAGGALCGHNNAIVLLASPDNTAGAASLMASNAHTGVYALGGENSLPDAVVDAIK